MPPPNTSDIYALAIVVAELLLGRKVDLSLNRGGSQDNLSFLKDIPSEVSAVLIVGSSSASMDIDRYRLFQTMVIVLIAMAISGFVIAIKTSEKLNTVFSIYLRKTKL